MAVEMALMLDSRTSAAQKAMCGQRLHEAMIWLRSQLPPSQEADSVDELKERRRHRLARRANA
jgi:hypothetical protein